jgi:diphthine-ammonia ligase
MDINNQAFFCSWSGGKDSCLSLYYAIKEGGKPRRLLTMLTEDGVRSRAHGLSVDFLKKQSALLDISLTTYATSWEAYETNFISALKEFKKSDINLGIFGDIDLEEHREWVRRVCGKADMSAYQPLWGKPHRQVLEEFIANKFKAVIVAVNGKFLDRAYLGREVNIDLLQEFEEIGIDPAGENGEYHTVVTGGPIFANDIEYRMGEQIKNNGYWFQNITIQVA